MGEREIEIVATEQNMVAHRDALKSRKRRVRLGLDGKEAQIRRSSADIHHQHMGFLISHCEGFERCVIIFQPSVEGSLRLFEEDAGTRKTCFPRGFESELLCSGVEGSRHRDGDILRSQRSIRVCLVPSRGKSLEEIRQGINRADQVRRRKVAGAQREKFGTAVRCMMHKPRFCGMDNTPRDLSCTGTGEASDDPMLALVRRKIKKRGKGRLRD